MSREMEEVKGSAPWKAEDGAITYAKIKGEYSARGLDVCHFCGLKFNVGERIPRIIVGCGHTFCTSCLSYFLRNNRIRCPMCRKLLKGVESVDKLPLNFNILYEVVTKDPLLSTVNFEKCLQADPDAYQDDEAYERDCAMYMCQKHEQRIKHFYCSEHPSIFCRECIKDLHNMDACFVVDLYEIEKMRKLQQQNNEMNRRQLSRRQDGATESYIEPISISPPKEARKPIAATAESRRPRHEPKSIPPADQYQPKRFPAQPAKSSMMVFDSNQFDAQGVSPQDAASILAAQHLQMLMNAGNKNFPNQQDFGYGQEEQNDSFTDEEDENGEEEEENSDFEEEELNSAQKQKLKRDLMMMGFGENGEFEGDEDGDQEDVIAAQAAFIAGLNEDQQHILMMQQKQHQLLIQQAQFQEAMRIQMLMKQNMPIEVDGSGASMGLRVKNNPHAKEKFELPQTVDDQPFEDQMDQQRKFELDKKLFAQQMKEQLLGRKPAPKAAPVIQKYEEVKAHATIHQESADDDSYDEEEGSDGNDDKSFNSQIEIGQAVLDSQDEMQDGLFQTPPVHKQLGQNGSQASPLTPGDAVLESRRSLTEIQQNSGSKMAAEETDTETQMKENTAPQRSNAAAAK